MQDFESFDEFIPAAHAMGRHSLEPALTQPLSSSCVAPPQQGSWITPKVIGVAVGVFVVCAVLAFYFWRRASLDAASENGPLARWEAFLQKRFMEVEQQMQQLQQHQDRLAVQLRSVAEHSETVEEALSEALEQWNQTFELQQQEGAADEAKPGEGDGADDTTET